jgi:hypothetical protein
MRCHPWLRGAARSDGDNENPSRSRASPLHEHPLNSALDRRIPKLAAGLAQTVRAVAVTRAFS